MSNDRTPSAKVLTQLALEVFRTNGVLLEAGNAITAPSGLTSARWQVMGAIYNTETPLSVAQIARRMGLTRQSVQRIVNDLEAMQILELKDNIDHKRARLVLLTPKGQALQAEVNKAQIAWANTVSEGIEAAELVRLVRLLTMFRKRTESYRVKLHATP